MKNLNKNPEKENTVEEPATVYSTTKKQGIDENFDFYKEFKNGYTPEEFLAEMKKRMEKWDWKK